MSAKDSKKDFFISYNKADADHAVWIAHELEVAGYSTIIQAWDFRPGNNFVLMMDEALKIAEHTIGVLSPDYFTSGFAMAEFAATFAEDPTGEMRKFIPIRVRSCEVEGLLRSIIYLDLVGLSEPDAREALLEVAKCDPAAARIPGKCPKWLKVFRGTLPKIWNIPHRRNPNFTGREEILTDLREALTSGKPAALTQAMHGLGGIGKTQLALEYAYRHKADYDIVWWVRSEDPSTLASDYAALAGELNLPIADPSNQPEIAAAVKAHLGHITGWLLIFDNVEKPEHVRPYLPLGETGHVIITSRESDWSGTASELSVKVWPRKESVAFLLRRTGRDEPDDADKLADVLGDFPLALEQAGAYIRKAGKSLADYTALYEKHRQDLLERGKPATDYEATVATTWEISFEALRKESPAGADLLNLCAFFAPDDIPLDIIRSGAQFLPEPLAGVVQDELKLDEALIALGHYSLAECQDGKLSVHRLVQAVTLDRLSEDDQKKWAEAAVRLVKRAFPQEDYDLRPWYECAWLVPHAMAAVAHARDLAIQCNATGKVLDEVGLYLRRCARFVEAQHVLEQAVMEDERSSGPNHHNVAVDLNDLGLVLLDLGDPKAAKEHFERALSINKSTYGPSHSEIAINLNNLGLVLSTLGDHEGAKAYYEQALDMDRDLYGPEHPAVAIRLCNLGFVLYRCGEFRRAYEYFERALAIDETAFGPNDPKIVSHLGGIGLVLRRLGDLQGAKEHFKRELGICGQFLGNDHPDTERAQSWLDIVLREIDEKESG